MKVRIEKIYQGDRYQFFVDYKVEKDCWKNYSVFDSYAKALTSKNELLQKHMTSPDCWCGPDFVDGIYVHHEAH